jgi:50S ribosomal subunit-associated GTPase HflX
MVILNKIDALDSPDDLEKFQSFFQDKNMQVLSISAINGDGIADLKETLAELFENDLSN